MPSRCAARPTCTLCMPVQLHDTLLPRLAAASTGTSMRSWATSCGMCALQVVACEDTGQVLGYLPATVAACLVSLVQDRAVDISVTVLERPKTPKSSLPITVQVTTSLLHISSN